MKRPDAAGELGGLTGESSALLRDAVGYLSFSSGKSDPKFLAALNQLYPVAVAKWLDAELKPWQRLGRLLSSAIQQFAQTPEGASDRVQAQAAVRLAFDHVLPEYRKFHRDLLFHQPPERLFGPLMLGRVLEAVLAQGPPWDASERIVQGALAQLNDYLGYRPVAVLRTAQKLEPYPHERVRAVPLYIAGAGVDAALYHNVVETALKLLRETDPELLHQAWFDPNLLEELAFDPRAYDFDHPVHKRPNHHFGQWDLQHVDNRGFFRRYVVQQVTLDALSARLDEGGRIPHAELLVEAAAVLAGTILMGSGTSGNAPDAHDSSTTLANLLPHIASYRDAFYENLLTRIGGTHGERLASEAQRLKQPFGGARQDLNARLARLRASQLEHVHLAELFARMGYSDAARRQAHVIPVAAARIMCEMQCRMASTHLALDRTAASPAGGADAPAATEAQLAAAEAQSAEIEDLLRRGIACGAIIDPWNILGFDAQFGLFLSPADSVHDHRADELIELMARIFDLYGRTISEAAATGHREIGERLSAALGLLADWWDKFATLEVSSVESISGREAHESAIHVSQALAAWHQKGAAAGNVAFWREHVADFQSAKTFARVVDALLAKQDFVAAMGLLIQWVGQSDSVSLEEGEDSFHVLVDMWLTTLLASNRSDRWSLALKLFDYLEANAEPYWEVPQLELTQRGGEAAREAEAQIASDEEEGDDADSDLYGAAYEGVVYRDSTADGIDADMLEAGGSPTDYELEIEARRLSGRLSFLATLAGLWRTLAVYIARLPEVTTEQRHATIRWRERATQNHRQLHQLLTAIERHGLAAPGIGHDALVEYDRRRMIKESLLERVIATAVATADAALLLAAPDAVPAPASSLGAFEAAAAPLLAEIFRGDRERIAAAWPRMLETLRGRTILYIPLPRGGDPKKIVEARSVQQFVHQLLAWLPRRGMLAETFELIDAVRAMEVDHPVGAGAVTEFDRLFETGYKALVDCLIASSQSWPSPEGSSPGNEGLLMDLLQQLTEPVLLKWLAHSQTLRLSVLERVEAEAQWRDVVSFIQRYGNQLFTQMFLTMGNLRAILHQGVENWLAHLESDESEELPDWVRSLDRELPRADAVRHLSLILEAVVDNYAEYRDYNSTTTQSDRGEMLHTLLAFLRLKAAYDRTHWNLRPVVMAHEMLVRRGRNEAAELWRRALAERTAEMADQLQRRLARLQKKHGMKLPTVADRIGERFIRPLVADRMLALVQPAMEELRSAEPTLTFPQLEAQTDELTEEPTGVGLDVPDWLAALEEEVDRASALGRYGRPPDGEDEPIPQRLLSFEEVQEQLERMQPGE